jgi:hypothetical protein
MGFAGNAGSNIGSAVDLTFALVPRIFVAVVKSKTAPALPVSFWFWHPSTRQPRHDTNVRTGTPAIVG